MEIMKEAATYLEPNKSLIGLPGSRAQLATPALLIEMKALQYNLQAMAEQCRSRSLALRPHVKTHKCSRIAQMQIDAGAIGVCAATLREVAVLVEQRIPGIHLTTPLVGGIKTAMLAALIGPSQGLSATIDNLKVIEDVEDILRRQGQTLPILVDVDMGAMFRTGAATQESAIAIVQRVAASDVLRYTGIQFYSGMVQHIPRWQDRQAAYAQQLDRLATLLDKLTQLGLKPGIISGGGTGSVSLDAASGLFTENQAGSYLFMDAEYVEVDILQQTAHPFKPALFVQGSVISKNVRGIVTTDTGTKSLATDGPLPRLVQGAPEGAIYNYFGDEFGMIIAKENADLMQRPHNSASTAGLEQPPHELFFNIFSNLKGPTELMELGAKFELLTPHCDPTVNLHRVYHCVDGDTLVDIWPVDMRGSL